MELGLMLLLLAGWYGGTLNLPSSPRIEAGETACHDLIRVWSGGNEIGLRDAQILFPGKTVHIFSWDKPNQSFTIACEGTRFNRGEWEELHIFIE